MADSTGGWDILRDGLFTTDTTEGRRKAPLARLLALLLSGDMVTDLPNLAAEQRGPWWRFLVRCAAKALHELKLSVSDANGTAVEGLEACLAAVLAGLVPDGGWRLWQPDFGRPGFLQPPTPGGEAPEEAGYKTASISELTAALGGKNHERKTDAVRRLDAEALTYSLVELQTMAIYGGIGRYQSQFQGSKSGAGSGTPFMGVLLPGGVGATFRHDTSVLLSAWDRVAQDLSGRTWALWCEPWAGQKDESIPAARLDPAFIPFARQVRLAQPVDGWFLGVWHRSAKGERVTDHTDGGMLGDPFCPAVVKDGRFKVRGTLAKGYDYREVVQLLYGEGAKPSPAVAALADEPKTAERVRVVFEGIAYEQGKTAGFHRREVLLPPRAWDWFARPQPVQLAHAKLLEQVSGVRKALRTAAFVIVGTDHGALARPGDILEEILDREYLGRLLDAAERLERGEPACDQTWTEWLRGQALRAFREALPWLPSSTAGRLKREVRAEARLRHLLNERLVPGDASAVEEER